MQIIPQTMEQFLLVHLRWHRVSIVTGSDISVADDNDWKSSVGA